MRVMEPRIQYATTSDGVSIAYWTLGEGLPFVHMPWFRMSNIQLEWQIPQVSRWYQALSGKRRLVRYDGRGSGLSDRDVKDYSLDALVLDLEAVADRLGLERFALFGVLHTGPVAIAYAARHPERISHLILWCTYARAADYARSTEIQATRGLMDKDWQLYTQTLAHVRLGWSEGEPAQRFAAVMRESITPQALQAHIDASGDLDVRGLLPQVTAPALVLHRRQLSWLGVDVARGLAARIPDARLALLEGESGAPYLGDTTAVMRAIDGFLGGGVTEPAAVAAAPSPAGSLRTILFTDIEGSTALTERLGDARARELLRDHERTVREALAAHGGSEVKTMGDGFMASFGSATKALECAVAIQRAFESPNQQTNKPANQEKPIRVRIGLNAGEPVAEEGDLFGTAVNLAARIAGQARGSEILVSDVVRQLVAGKGFAFDDRGEQALKGFEEPVRLFQVRWRDEP